MLPAITCSAPNRGMIDCSLVKLWYRYALLVWPLVWWHGGRRAVGKGGARACPPRMCDVALPSLLLDCERLTVGGKVNNDLNKRVTKRKALVEYDVFHSMGDDFMMINPLNPTRLLRIALPPNTEIHSNSLKFTQI